MVEASKAAALSMYRSHRRAQATGVRLLIRRDHRRRVRKGT
jgi:hypothetical protein